MKLSLSFCLVATLLMSSGCGNGLVDFRSRVTLDGKPLPKATVTLYGTDSGHSRPSVGMTDEQGVARFTTFKPGDGVFPGDYRVVISKAPQNLEEEFANFDPNNPEDMQKMMMRERTTNVPYTPSALPRIYLDPQKTPLTCTVPSEEEVVFALDSADEKRGG